MAAEAGGEREEEEEATGVLLYYKYAPVPDVSALVRFYGSDCAALGLLGRVRVAPDGVNVTIGGKMSSLEKHIATLKSMSLFAGTDFKLASCSHPSDERIAKECGCTSLSIRVVKELVTFRSNPLLKSPEISNAGRHLSAVEFHSVLQDVRNRLDSQSDMQNRQLLLLDARNLYETRIGRFQTPNVETLDPEIRQYSDLPAWIDEHSKKLHGKHVLMYCTGGIRCEMASAYIRSKGAGFENVFQLFGGIQRYLEQYPDGGYFKGKNFVFDHRISVGSKDADILGACLVCGSSFDDYSSRCRCMYCRMLVLVCYSCQGKSSAGSVCELCQKHGKGGQMVPLARDNQLQPGLPPDSSETIEIGSASLTYHAPSFPELSMRHGNNPSRKLRILCLHGFRQNASNFKGRTSSLAKKLRSIVEFVFIDAPHELAFIYHPRSSEQNHRHINLINPPLQDKWKKRFAWMIAPKSNYLDGPDCRAVDEPFDPLQYQQQTDGFEESYTYLKTVFSQMGPFDGILGFSQGAAMASLFCERQQRCCDTFVFRFAILCSGFSPTAMGLSKGIISCPSLHIFGNIQGEDRQISCQASMELAGLFDEGSSMVIEHDMGHIIPTRSPYIDQMKDFLQRFL